MNAQGVKGQMLLQYLLLPIIPFSMAFLLEHNEAMYGMWIALVLQ